MNPENAPLNQNVFTIVEVNSVLEKNPIIMEDGERIANVGEFDPKSNKGILIAGESQHITEQLILTTERNGETLEREVFGKFISNPHIAEIERQSYLRCKKYNIKSLNFLASIPLSNGILNITETYPYLLPFSKVKIPDIETFESLLLKGISALDSIHSIGIHHRDCLARNMAMNYLNPYVFFFFDFETATLLNPNTYIPASAQSQDKSLFLQDMFFLFLKQNEQKKHLIKEAECLTEIYQEIL